MISIATPTALHAPVALAALAAGVHVLSEKPLAESVERAAAMVAAAKANDRVLDVSFNHRRRGDVKMLKKVIDDGLLGEIYYAKAGWLRRSGIPGLGTWFTQKSLAGGGPLMDIGVHMLDMALHLMGEPTAEAVSAATYAEFGPRGRGRLERRPGRAPGRTGPVRTRSRTSPPRSSGCPAARRSCWRRAGRPTSSATSSTSCSTARRAAPCSGRPRRGTCRT